MILDFAATLTTTVTASSTCQYDWIARTGKHGVYTLLSKLAPKVQFNEDRMSLMRPIIYLGIAEKLGLYGATSWKSLPKLISAKVEA